MFLITLAVYQKITEESGKNLILLETLMNHFFRAFPSPHPSLKGNGRRLAAMVRYLQPRRGYRPLRLVVYD
jgi:hypothetical protein